MEKTQESVHYRCFIVESEHAAEWNLLREQWLTDYQPETAPPPNLRRETDRYDGFPEQHQRMQFFQRRLDHAERAFLRWQRAAEQILRAASPKPFASSARHAPPGNRNAIWPRVTVTSSQFPHAHLQGTPT